jgi:hypothetical protein
VTLTAGNQIMRVFITGSGFNLNWIQITGKNNGIGSSTVVYDEALNTEWTETKWTWGGTTDLNNTLNVRSGSRSARVNISSAYGGLVFNKITPQNTSDFPGGISFWIFSSQALRLQAAVFFNANTESGLKRFNVPANQWTQVKVAWSEVGSPAKVAGIRIGDVGEQAAASYTFYVDELQLSSIATGRPAQNSPIDIVVTRKKVETTLFPNPASGNIQVRLFTAKNQVVKFSITDITGKLIINKMVSVTSGFNLLKVSVPDRSGPYLMKVEKDGKVESIKFLVK